jgi:hypothetical protein
MLDIWFDTTSFIRVQCQSQIQDSGSLSKRPREVPQRVAFPLEPAWWEKTAGYLDGVTTCESRKAVRHCMLVNCGISSGTQLTNCPRLGRDFGLGKLGPTPSFSLCWSYNVHDAFTMRYVHRSLHHVQSRQTGNRRE